MFHKINKKIGISELEASRVHFSWVSRFLFQIGFVVSWTILTALFVEQFGIQNLLLFFLFDAGLLMIGTILAGRFLSCMSLRTFLLVSISLTTLLLGVSFFFPPSHLAFFVCVILAKDLFFAQTNIALYRLTETFFSPSEAQRLMPFIESAVTVGAVVGSLLVLWFLGLFPTQFVLSIWGGSLLILGGLMIFMPRLLHSIPNFFRSSEEKVSQKPLSEAICGMKKVHFLKHMLVLLLLQSAVFTIVEFQFTKDVQSHIAPHASQNHLSLSNLPLQASLFHDVGKVVVEIGHTTKEQISQVSSHLIMHKTLAHDLGMFHLLFALFALAVQFLLTPKILKTFGIIGSIFSYFLILLGALGAFILGYGSVNFLRMIQHGTHSIGESAYHISFYSLFSHRRESIRLFLEGITKPLGIGFGVFLIFVVPSTFIFPVALLATTIVLFVCFPMRKSFTHLSRTNLSSDDNIEGKLHSIEILGQKGHRDPALILSQKLKNKKEHEIIREKLIRVLSEIGDPRAVHTYVEILRDSEEDLEVKIQTLDSLFHLEISPSYWEQHAFTRYHLLETLKDIFDVHDHAHLRKLVIMNIFKHLPSHEVAPFFLKTMEKADDKLKAIYLRSCQMFSDPEIAFYVRKYLGHSDPRLQSHAVIALWKFGDKTQLQKMLYNLLNEENEDAQVSALYAIGEVGDREGEKYLLEFMDHPNTRVRLHALIALAKLNNEVCVKGLLEIIFGESYQWSQSAFHMLDRVSPDIRNLLQKEIQAEVSRRVFTLLQSQTNPNKLPQTIFNSLKQLYRMAERYDDLLAMERYQ